MADKKISALTAAGSLTGTELFPVVQSGTTKKATTNQLVSLANSGVTLAIALANGSSTGTNDISINTGQTIVSQDMFTSIGIDGGLYIGYNGPTGENGYAQLVASGLNLNWDDNSGGTFSLLSDATRAKISHNAKIILDAPLIEIPNGTVIESTNGFSVIDFQSGAGLYLYFDNGTTASATMAMNATNVNLAWTDLTELNAHVLDVNGYQIQSTTAIVLDAPTIQVGSGSNLLLDHDATLPMEPITYQQGVELVTGLYDLRGGYNASSNLFPATGGSGIAGAILKADTFIITVAGAGIGEVGDEIIALVDTPGQTSSNWAKLSHQLGYTPITNTLNSTQILVGNGSNVATAVSMSGDVTINNLGVTAIGSGVILNADINAAAAIAYSKLNLTGAILNADLAGSIANSKLANSTISGVALGSNLFTLTIGAGLSGTSYNGSAGVSITIDSTVATLTGAQALSNKTGLISQWTNDAGYITSSSTTFLDSVFRIQDNGDATKQIAFEASGITTATTRTLTAQNWNGTIVTTGGANDVGAFSLTANGVILGGAANEIWGGTASGGNFLIGSTSNATKGIVTIDNLINFSGALATIGINTAAVANQPITSSFTLNGSLISRFINLSTGTSGTSAVLVQNSTGSTQLLKYSSGYTTAGLLTAGLGRIANTASGNLLIDNTVAGTSIIFAIAGTAAANQQFEINASGIKVFTGVNNNGSGFKHARVTTGSVAAGSTALVTVTWSTAFADANYTVQASVLDSTTTSLSLSVVHIESVVAGSITVRVLNNSVGSLTGTIHCVAVHD